MSTFNSGQQHNDPAVIIVIEAEMEAAQRNDCDP